MKPRFFLRADIKFLSPVAIGNGRGGNTDKDVLLGSDGKPYLPGSALAGICRHFLEEEGAIDNVRSLFGYEDRSNELESRIVFYDANLTGSFVKSFRDGVRIGNDGVVADTGKFDFEIVDFCSPRSSFGLRLEVENWNEETDKPIVDRIIRGIQDGLVRMGAKITRGLGRMELKNVRFLCVTDLQNLIEFSWDNVTEPYSIPEGKTDAFSRSFDVTSFVTVSTIATRKSGSDDKEQPPNSAPQKRANGDVVIPGTSWAGVFLHHFKEILERCGKESQTIDAFLGRLFGSTEQMSRILFDDVSVIGSHCMTQTRNAIDRFTGGACDKKLFTNELAFGGRLTLTVLLRKGLSEEDEKLAKNLITLTLDDLGEGLVNVGGLGSVGGGILRKAEE